MRRKRPLQSHANGPKLPFSLAPHAAAQLLRSRHGVSAANPACEVSNIAIVDGETLKREENDHETLRWN